MKYREFKKLVKEYSKEMKLEPIHTIIAPSFSKYPNCYAFRKTIMVDSSYFSNFLYEDAKRLVCHELSHIKNKDKGSYGNTILSRLTNICQEIRADIEGNQYAKLSSSSIIKIFDMYQEKYNMSKKEAFDNSYPDYKTRAYFVCNFDVFDEAVLCEILYQYRDFYKPEEEDDLFDFLKNHLFRK